MSSVSDHIQLMKSQEKQYDSVFNKREWLYINDTVTQYDQGTSIIETTSLRPFLMGPRKTKNEKCYWALIGSMVFVFRFRKAPVHAVHGNTKTKNEK